MDALESALRCALLAMQRGDWISARTSAEGALAADPLSPDAHHTLGAVYWQTDSREAALSHLERSVQLRADATWINNLGVAYAALGRWNEASDAFERSLELRPDDASTLSHYGRTLCERGTFAVARDVLKRAVAIDSGRAAVWVDLGWALSELREFVESHSALVHALAVAPPTPQVHRLLVRVCWELHRIPESIDHAQALAELDPSGKTFAELAVALWRAGDLGASVQAMEQAFSFGITDPDLHSALLYLMLFDPQQSAHSLKLAHRSWAITHCRLTQSPPDFADRVSRKHKLRIGYLSAGLFTSPVRHSRRPLISNADTGSFDVYHYGAQPASDGDENRYATLPGLYRNVHLLSDSELFALIQADKIDILVDLVGHHSFGRLRVFSQRAAPVQIAYTSYPGTTGVDEVDYFLTDGVVTPPGTEHEYSEAVWRMPSGYLMYAPPPNAPEGSAPPASANGFPTFGLFQREAKLNDSCWDAIARLLTAIPESRLLIHHESPGFDFENGEYPHRIISALEVRGIAAVRVTFKGRRPMEAHLQILGEADVALDTFPYNGHTITCECLWMGVPVVTLAGDRHACRIGAGLLHQAGLDEWIAHSVEEYVEVASRLASDTSALEHWRSALRKRVAQSTLLDTQTRTREIEQIYREAFDGWRRKRISGRGGPG